MAYDSSTPLRLAVDDARRRPGKACSNRRRGGARSAPFWRSLPPGGFTWSTPRPRAGAR